MKNPLKLHSLNSLSTFFSAALVLVLTACAPRLDVVWKRPEYSGDKFNKLVVVAITDNLDTRNTFEETAVKLLKMKGIQAGIQGNRLFPTQSRSKTSFKGEFEEDRHRQ